MGYYIKGDSRLLVCPKCRRRTVRTFKEADDGYGVCNKNGCDARLIPASVIKGEKKLLKARLEYEKINSITDSSPIIN